MAGHAKLTADQEEGLRLLGELLQSQEVGPESADRLWTQRQPTRSSTSARFTRATAQEAIIAALGNTHSSAAASVKALVASLGLPTSLRDANIDRAQLPVIAERAAKHPVVAKNPRKIHGAEDVLEILELAW